MSGQFFFKQPIQFDDETGRIAYGTAAQTYRYFRLDVSGSDGGTRVRVGDLEIVAGGVDYPTSAMTSNTAPSPLVASASSEDSPRDAWRAFNKTTGGDPEEEWWSTAGAPQWVQIDLGSGNEIAPSSIKLTAPAANTQHAPSDFTLEASNTGSFGGEEDTLLTVTGETSWGASEERTFNI